MAGRAGTIHPMVGRLFTLLSALSLVLCVATCALWARSCFRVDTVYWTNEMWSGWGVSSKRGEVVVSVRHLHGLNNGPERFRYIGGPGSASVMMLPYGMVRRSWAGFYVSDAGGREVNPFGSYIWSDHYYAVPDWFIVVISGLGSFRSVRWCARRFRDGRRRARGCCAACGYNLRATPERCPECGTAASSMSTA